MPVQLDGRRTEKSPLRKATMPSMSICVSEAPLFDASAPFPVLVPPLLGSTSGANSTEATFRRGRGGEIFFSAASFFMRRRGEVCDAQMSLEIRANQARESTKAGV